MSCLQLLNRRPPFGLEVQAFVKDLPQYLISVEEDDVTSYSGKKPVTVDLTISISLSQPIKLAKHSKYRVKSLGMTSVLTTTSDLEYVDFRRIP